ncbi:MAG: hypothetical protein JJ939_11525 [Alphaproteobacteria bacterium]|nr:hypothetical protein [Alphaproteobacteria bacterium]MBO6629045.1 hypothetical protein [Alphaproteobacteria bacterium]
MRTDIENLTDGTEVYLIPFDTNPLTRKKHRFVYSSGYFYSKPPLSSEVGPDFYFGDVFAHNEGFELVEDRE